MNEFDEQCAVHRLQQLLLERWIERTPMQIRELAAEFVRRTGVSNCDAYEALEQNLLSRKPFKEPWEL